MDVLADSVGALPAEVEHRNSLRKTNKVNRRRTINHRVRLTAKRYAAQHRGLSPNGLIQAVGLPLEYEKENTSGKRCDSGEARLQLENALRKYQIDETPEPCPKHGTLGRSRLGLPNPKIVDQESVALARSRVPLPSDRHRSIVRQPSLEREDAFCDASTFRGKVRVQRVAPAIPADDDAQVAELYRMGLLYDEDEVPDSQGSIFDLNTIHHEEPIYTIRQSRRHGGRKFNKTRNHQGSLDLNLSFADLGNDNDLAQYLISSRSSQSSADDEAVQHSPRRHHSRNSSAPLRVIYELTSSRPSFDVDTSQPPDLITDSLSEYDYFSDSDLDGDVPSQEVHDIEPATSASGPWVMLGDGS